MVRSIINVCVCACVRVCLCIHVPVITVCLSMYLWWQMHASVVRTSVHTHECREEFCSIGSSYLVVNVQQTVAGSEVGMHHTLRGNVHLCKSSTCMQIRPIWAQAISIEDGVCVCG